MRQVILPAIRIRWQRQWVKAVWLEWRLQTFQKNRNGAKKTDQSTAGYVEMPLGSQLIRRWQHFHSSRNPHQPPLAYRDGGSFLLIRQEQIHGPVLRHRLQGTSRELYLFCRRIRTMDDICLKFPGLQRATLTRFFQDLGDKKLIFHENNRYIALAIHKR